MGACVLAVMALLLGSPAQAASILQVRGFAGSAFGAIGVTPFDPTLGTLDSVDVRILGLLTVGGTTLPNLMPTPAGPVPIPYTYQVSVQQRFFGPQKFFEFNGPAVFTFSGSATGVGEQFLLGTNYSYAFSFNSSTDAIGFALPTVNSGPAALAPPLSGISGPLADFVDDGIPINEIDLSQPFPTTLGFGGPSPIVAQYQTSGSLQITYNYTPFAQPVPEPASVLMVSLGLGGLAVRRFRTRR